jgi:hypothetical protein
MVSIYCYLRLGETGEITAGDAEERGGLSITMIPLCGPLRPLRLSPLF